MSDTAEPTYDTDDRPCLILDLPDLSDEAALQLSEFLQNLLEHFDTHYSAQILRAHRALENERERLYRERCIFEAQQPLPFGDILF